MGSRELFSGCFATPQALTLPTAAQLGPDRLESTYAAMRAGQDEQVAALLDGWQALEIMHCEASQDLAATAVTHLEKAADLARSAGNLGSKIYLAARLGLAYAPVFGTTQTNDQPARQQRASTKRKLNALTHEVLDTPEEQTDYETVARLLTYCTMLRFGPEEIIYPGSPREAHLPGGGRYRHNSYTILPSGKKLPIDVQLSNPPRFVVGERLLVARVLKEARLQSSPPHSETVGDKPWAGLRWAATLSIQEAGGRLTSPLTRDEIEPELNKFGWLIRRQIVHSYLSG